MDSEQTGNRTDHPADASPLTQAHIEEYRTLGYTLIKGVFARHEIARLAEACDRWKFFGQLLGRTWRRQNTVIWVNHEAEAGAVVRGMQWPSYHDPVWDHVRTDPRLRMILEPLLGPDIKQIINQVHWKQPGSQVTWPLHRDVRTRQPVEAFRNLFTSWVQTGIAIDPHRPENGAMKIVPGSHMDCEHNPRDTSLYNVPQYENDPRIKDLVMDPGDVALWNAYTVHGGGFNTTAFLDRRFYINGFAAAEHCDRGEWVWRDGRTCHLHGPQALIQFKQAATLKEGHYPADRNRKEEIAD